MDRPQKTIYTIYTDRYTIRDLYKHTQCILINLPIWDINLCFLESLDITQPLVHILNPTHPHTHTHTHNQPFTSHSVVWTPLPGHMFLAYNEMHLSNKWQFIRLSIYSSVCLYLMLIPRDSLRVDSIFQWNIQVHLFHFFFFWSSFVLAFFNVFCASWRNSFVQFSWLHFLLSFFFFLLSFFFFSFFSLVSSKFSYFIFFSFFLLFFCFLSSFLSFFFFFGFIQVQLFHFFFL